MLRSFAERTLGRLISRHDPAVGLVLNPPEESFCLFIPMRCGKDNAKRISLESMAHELGFRSIITRRLMP
jgi:hypothetical protein